MSPNQRGITLIEILVGIVLTSLIIATALAASLTSKKAIRLDTARTALNQSLRSGLSVIGNDLRMAGEGLNQEVPALEVFPTTSPFQLIARRRIFPWTFSLCDAISVGSSVSSLTVSVKDTSSLSTSCSYDGNSSAIAQLEEFVRTWSGSELSVFLFDTVSRQGDLMPLSGVDDRITSHLLRVGSRRASLNYAPETTRIFLIEEWSYRVRNEVLELIVNRKETSPVAIVDGITSFIPKVVIRGSELEEYNHESPLYDWTLIRLVQVTLKGKSLRRTGGINPFSRKEITREVLGEFFPRNILSARN
jgi:type II secretory pathway pseudopilin PulG